MADTGLLITHAFNGDSVMHQKVAKAIVNDRLEFNKGMIFENIVAQMFRANNKKLYFYSRSDSKNSANTIEIDFLIADETNPIISPIEVKSGRNYTTSSMNKFINKFNIKLGKKYLIRAKDLNIKDDIIYLPVYMTMFL